MKPLSVKLVQCDRCNDCRNRLGPEWTREYTGYSTISNPNDLPGPSTKALMPASGRDGQ
eukprot:m.224330 g.224330  ORF g.224330 m.224330 type:complete len:59 (-) comp15950_c0_seq6:2070-2246(-)